MRKATIGFFLILLIGMAGIGIWKYLKPLVFEKKQRLTSDAAESLYTLRIGGDNYLGYWFITSPEMRKIAARRGLQIEFTDDQGAYAERLAAFSRREYDCIVLPINSYLEQGAAHQFPGVIVAAVSESKGADGIVGFTDRLPSNKINDLNDPGLKIVYTADSPSSFLMDLTIADFDLDRLRTSTAWQVKVNGSRDVLKSAQKGKGDVFILWEPDLSKALEIPGMKYVWGSDKFTGYIVDVFVFHRDFVGRHPDQVREFLSAYFRTLEIYGNNPDTMITEMTKSTDLKKETLNQLLKKIEWYSLSENCLQEFGIAEDKKKSQEGVINTIIACTDVFLRMGTFKKDPLQGNPYLITHSSFLEELSKTQVMAVAQNAENPNFAALTQAQWTDLKEIGTFRVEPISFQSWNNELTPEGKEKVNKIAVLLQNNYPHYRILVRGHTGPGGSEAENMKLSTARAQMVAQYLKTACQVDGKRIQTEGVGSAKPAIQKPGESMRAFLYRLSRVEFIALEEN